MGTASATTLNILPAVGTGATGSTYTFGLFNPFNSGQFAGFSGSYLYSMPNYAATTSGGVPYDVNGCLFEPPNVQVIASQSTYVIPPGEGIVSVTAGATGTYQYQVQYASGTTGTATYWGTLNSYGGALNAFSYMSDGQNFRLMGTGQTAGTAVFIQWR